jgi:hypothetical protein
MLNHPGEEPQLGTPASSDGALDFSTVDVRLPMLVYISREKRLGYDHQKKAGAMNAQLRVSALLTNEPFIINFDGDHYINNSSAFRAAMCFMLDARHGDDTAFVQFPQRFDDVDPTDRYCNHNRVFFDATLLGLNGYQGPSYVGTGCMFRRAALYGAAPPRWRSDNSKTLVDGPCKQFGTSMPFINSIPLAANQERAISLQAPLDARLMAELDYVSTCAYEDSTDWGDGVGWVYNIATEDVVTGFRLHCKGWRSMYCTTDPDAFRGTAPTNLTERLYQILRWSGGSLDMFLSRKTCPLLAGRRLHPMQRVAYANMTVYPVCAAFIFAYDLLPLMWLSGGQFHVQKPFVTYGAYLFAGIAMMEVSGVLEVTWAGLTLPQRAVLHDRRDGGVPGRGAAQRAPARRTQGPAVQTDVQAAAAVVRGRREGAVRGDVRRAVGAAAGAEAGCDGRQRGRYRRAGREGRRVRVVVRAGCRRRGRAAVQRVGAAATLPVRARTHGAVEQEAVSALRPARGCARRRRWGVCCGTGRAPSRHCSGSW